MSDGRFEVVGLKGWAGAWGYAAALGFICFWINPSTMPSAALFGLAVGGAGAARLARRGGALALMMIGVCGVALEIAGHAWGWAPGEIWVLVLLGMLGCLQVAVAGTTLSGLALNLALYWTACVSVARERPGLAAAGLLLLIPVVGMGFLRSKLGPARLERWLVALERAILALLALTWVAAIGVVALFAQRITASQVAGFAVVWMILGLCLLPLLWSFRSPAKD